MIVQVIPNIRMPRRSTFFDYCVSVDMESEIKSGVIVSIPWRKKIITGVVYNISKTSKFPNLKNIISIIGPGLKPWQLKLIPWFSQYYVVSYSLALYTFLPEKPKKKVELKKYIPPRTITYTARKSAKPIFKNININKANNLTFLEDYQHRLDYIYSEIDNAIKNKTQAVIIFPTVNELSGFYYSLGKDLQKKIDVLTNKLSKSQYWNIWQRAYNNDFKIILATRMGVFLPFGDETRVIIDQIERIEHKQTDMNPRYNLADIINFKISNNSDTVHSLLTFFSNVNIYTNSKKQKFIINQNKPLHNKLHLIKHKSFQAKFEFIENLIKEDENNNIFIFLNRKGNFTTFQCRDCAWTAQCPVDKNLLKLHKESLECHDCRHTEIAPNTCPKCSSINLNGIGIGTSNIENLLKEKVKNYTISRLDSDSDVEYIDFSKKNIIIGTEYVLSKIPLYYLDVCLFFSGNTDLLLSDYRSAERSLGLYNRIIRQTNSKTRIIINTNDTEHTFWQDLTSDFNNFITKELKSRKQFSYPPFIKLTKLIYANINEKKARETTQLMFGKLTNKLFTDYQILAPQKNIPYREHKKYYNYILIKAKVIDLKPVVDELDEVWLVDRDPQKL